MSDKIKIIVDTGGSDKGADEMIMGAALALEKNERLYIALSGDEEHIKSKIAEYGAPADRIEILAADGEVTNYDDPAEAVFKKTGSSMMTALRALGERDDLFGLITAGNTGALIAGTVRYLSGKNRVRPALSAILPSSDGSFTCLVDTGATIDCTPAMLLHFAHLGSDFMKKMYAIESPRIGLLSNGSEPTKGNKLVKETHALLAEADDLNFVGNVEGNKALSGCCDVLVCDGFAGNQVLKVSEGMAMRMMTDIVKYAKRTGSEEVMKLFGHLMSVYDLSSLGGGIILGPEKTVIKTRGSAEAAAIVSTSQILLNMADNKSVFDKEKNKI